MFRFSILIETKTLKIHPHPSKVKKFMRHTERKSYVTRAESVLDYVFKITLGSLSIFFFFFMILK